MIPIRASNGCTIAFGGRLVEKMNRLDRDHAPKYLNSCESLLYRKSETLFGLDLSKNEIRRSKSAVLVEGYFDVISLYGTGIQNVVALCSTALTNAHWSLLERLGASELVLLLDGDIAGTKAVERLAPTLLSLGVRARVATLPENDDPDTFVLREGRSALDEVISSAPPLSEHLLERLLPKKRAISLEEKMAALVHLRPILEGMAPSMAKTIFWSQLSDRLGVSESQIRAYLRQPTNGNAPRLTRKICSSSDRSSIASTSEYSDIHEELFAALLISDPNLKNEPESRFSDELRSLQLRMLLESENPQEDLASLPLAIRQGVERQLREIEFSLSDADAKRRALRESSIRLRLLRTEERKVSKQIEIQQAVARNASEEEIGQLLLEHTQLAALRSRLRERIANHSQSSRRQQL
jgi:DNA primase